MLKTLDKSPVAGKRILLRAAYDITLAKEGGQWIVPDDQRIRATLPTINYLLNQGCSIVVMGGWIQRPKPGQREDRFKMDPVARRLSELIRKPIVKLDNTVGPDVDAAIANLKSGDIIMLENTRFNEGEQEADPELARKMARLGEFAVFDAFGQSHRTHASTTGILEYHKQTCAAGFLMEQELLVLQKIVRSPIEPFVVVLGGVKISDKLGMMQNILDRAQMILVGGGLANTFFKAAGYGVGGSLVEGTFVNQAKGGQKDPLSAARAIFQKTRGKEIPHELIPDVWPNGERGTISKLQLPLDVIIGKKNAEGGFANNELIIKKVTGPESLCGDEAAILDIGPVTRALYGEIAKRARTIFWNGPMGLFEDFHFASGTREVAEAIADSNGFSVVGGGDTESVVTKFRLEGRFGHVSTGGGASLELLAGEELSVVPYLTV
ncbi:MAG: phosphoglycerate kinase [Candidatus Jacksonbacteria bacterium]|nr:phosphoglycerate kinase [Candidatus Jacksonbacteria bacterium]